MSNRPDISILTSGTDEYEQSETLMGHVDRLVGEITANKTAISTYKSAVKDGLAEIGGAVSQLNDIIGQLSDRINQLKSELGNASNRDKELANIEKLTNEKNKLLEVIKYANYNLGQIGLTGNNQELDVNELRQGFANITGNLTSAIARGNDALERSGGGGVSPSPSAAGGGGGGVGGGDRGSEPPLPAAINNQINFDSFYQAKNALDTATNRTDMSAIIRDNAKAVNSNNSITSENKLLINDYLTKYATYIANSKGLRGGKRARRRNTKKSRPHKKSKKSKKRNYMGGYDATKRRKRSRSTDSSSSNGRGRRKSHRHKHTSYSQ
jgi:hypothetical protein